MCESRTRWLQIAKSTGSRAVYTSSTVRGICQPSSVHGAVAPLGLQGKRKEVMRIPREERRRGLDARRGSTPPGDSRVNVREFLGESALLIV